jgi:V/A-type H+-transporting ATPase subunit I
LSILSLEKVTLCGMPCDKYLVLERLQQLGRMHLISLAPEPREPEKVEPPYAKDAYRALHYLQDVRHPRRQVMDLTGFDMERVVANVLTNIQRRRATQDQRDFLLRRIQELSPWGNFRLPKENELAGYKLWFYQLPVSQLEPLTELELPWQEIYRDNRFSYVTVVAREEPSHDALPVPRTHTGAVALEELHRQLLAIEIELEDIEAEHQSLSRWVYLIKRNLAQAEDRASLELAGSQTLERDGIFILQGWAARCDHELIERFAREYKLALVNEPPGQDETPPTLMANPPGVSGGQDLVSFYQTPSYRSWDPSGIVFFSFALFFAMILADAGYTLALAGIVTFFWKRLGVTPVGQRFRRLTLTVLGTAFVYGVLVGSYFGISPSPASLGGRLHLLDLNDFDTMMHLSVTIGCIHLALANAAVALRAGTFPANMQPLGWIGAIFGGLLTWFGVSDFGPAVLQQTGIALLIIGLVVVVLFASDRKADSLLSALLRLVDGLRSLTNITKVFGDVLSYMRLFALGLASASLAITFNQLADQIQEAMPGLGLLLSILVLVLGHAINLSLGIVSGFVHGLRLNFIEFFSWGISEEGYPFRAFAKKEIEK